MYHRRRDAALASAVIVIAPNGRAHVQRAHAMRTVCGLDTTRQRNQVGWVAIYSVPVSTFKDRQHMTCFACVEGLTAATP